jgi:hypothetical protein
MPGWHVSSMINVWTKYGELRFYDNGETDLIIVIAAIKAIPMSHLQQLWRKPDKNDIGISQMQW